ncbi:Ecdysteroid UDP-glucosyltransferase [Gryllus bimaculatus]|nr:Ecdysteroid UDP-glucosyltransferase [Gryllus bimaculatus]
MTCRDLQKFLDDATEGAIYMSFGTNVRSDKLSLAKRKEILEAFAELPQRVLWKFESDLPDVPKNVKISKWLPQNDVLDYSVMQ